jgi:hypothetical protein
VCQQVGKKFCGSPENIEKIEQTGDGADLPSAMSAPKNLGFHRLWKKSAAAGCGDQRPSKTSAF